MFKKQQSPKTFRLEEKVWSRLKKAKLKSGKNWDKFIADLIGLDDKK
jgi:hypothetical protein